MVRVIVKLAKSATLDSTQKKKKLKEDYVLQSDKTKDTSASSMSKRCRLETFDGLC